MPIAHHDPVLRDEVLRYLVTDPSGVYVDGTVGQGGHAEAVCRLLSAGGRLVCFDADGDALAVARTRLAEFGDCVTFVHANAATLTTELRALCIGMIQGLLLDLGVSSQQLDDAHRGFSFRADDTIDMRMDRRQEFSARDVLNTYDEAALARVFLTYGEERGARRIARKIVQARPIGTTGELRAIVERVVGRRFLVKSLARVFQALRIEVNAELENLEKVLEASLSALSPGGRIVVLSYHSLEDRVVKHFLKRESARGEGRPGGRLQILTRKPLTPGEAEIRRNPRARSAKMRVAERL